MTTASRKDRERLLAEVRVAQARAIEAITVLDITTAVGSCRALRSLAWRGTGLGLDVAALVANPDGPTPTDERNDP